MEDGSTLVVVIVGAVVGEFGEVPVAVVGAWNDVVG